MKLARVGGFHVQDQSNNICSLIVHGLSGIEQAGRIWGENSLYGRELAIHQIAQHFQVVKMIPENRGVVIPFSLLNKRSGVLNLYPFPY